jgi:hypothetical protein
VASSGGATAAWAPPPIVGRAPGLWSMVYVLWSMVSLVYGVWSMVHGLWCMVSLVYGLSGVWCMVYGVWSMVYNLWSMAYGLWFMVYGLMPYGSYQAPWCAHASVGVSIYIGDLCTSYGLWSMVYGLWSMVYGLWSMIYGLWSMVYGLYIGDHMIHCSSSGDVLTRLSSLFVEVHASASQEDEQ